MEETIPLLLKKDEIFQQIIDAYGYPKFPSRPEGFVSMCKTILEQQVSLASARASFNKLHLYLEGIAPAKMFNLSDEEFRNCGISRQKATYLRFLSRAVIENVIDFESFSHKTPEQVRHELIQLKGVGNWTIDVYLMFSLRSPDILPLGDIGIVSAMRDLLNLSTTEEMADYSKKWSPYRTTASFFLWHYYLEKRGRKFPD